MEGGQETCPEKVASPPPRVQAATRVRIDRMSHGPQLLGEIFLLLKINAYPPPKRKKERKKESSLDFPGDPVAKTRLLLQGTQTGFLVRELRCCVPHGVGGKKKQAHSQNKTTPFQPNWRY